MRFLKYVEIKTKITSVFAFLFTLSFLFYQGIGIGFKRTSIFFIAMLMFDLTTTAINNHIDSKTNNQTLQFKRTTSLFIICFMFALSAALGLYLVYITDIVVLILGAFCFLIGVLYTAGPIPISRMPLGELFSGLLYGFFIPIILLYINMPPGEYLVLAINPVRISLELNVFPVLTAVLLSVTPTCLTASIMLANNICDMEKDITVKRFTLPYYIGRKNALRLYAYLFYITYLSVIIMVALSILPAITLLSLLTLIPVQRNINRFIEVQDKDGTFPTSISNYITIMSANTLLIFLGGFFVQLRQSRIKYFFWRL